MKKYFNLCLLVLAFVLTTQSSFAQKRLDPNEIAIKKTEQLKTVMDLSNDQQKELIKLFQSFEEIENKFKSQSNEGVINQSRKEGLDKKLDYKLQHLLNEKQYKIYLKNRDLLIIKQK
jgi:predicted transcriptional regulator